MNSADVLVIGAGPAGSAAALALAKQGAEVALVDKHAFPRDKVCGDALIPDALNALERIALKDAVLSKARRMSRVRVYAPNGRFVDISGECACVRRTVLDDLVRRNAIAQGARFHPGLHLTAAVVEDGIVRGASFLTQHRQPMTIRAPITLLATGAAAGPLKLFDVCERNTPSATAARVYFEADDDLACRFDYLCLSYDRTICPGYGWIFPGPDGVFNVGVGYYYDSKSKPTDPNVRNLLATFLKEFPPAAALTARSRQLTSLSGAPLRTALTGSRLGRPGLLVIGEGAGLTYPLSGEGIGKAIESGLIAADVILNHALDATSRVDQIVHAYATRIRSAFGPRFSAYKTAQDWLSSPAVANFLAWRGSRSRFVRQRLEGIFQETTDPRQLFSVPGLIRALMT
jgi:geranylgeranyl reductase family protein